MDEKGVAIKISIDLDTSGIRASVEEIGKMEAAAARSIEEIGDHAAERVRGEAKQTTEAVADVDEKLIDVNRSAGDAAQQFNQMRETAERLMGLGVAIGGIGAAISGPLVLAARQYVDTVGEIEPTSRHITAAYDDIEDAQLRIGRVAAQTVLPVLEKIADLAEQAAQFAEDHPGAVQGALTIGGSLAAVGATMATVAGAMTTISNAGAILSKFGLVGGAAQAAGGAAGTAAAGGATAGIGAILPALGAGLGGVGLGAGIYNQFLRPEGGESAQTIFGQIAAMAAGGAGGLYGFVASLGDSARAAEEANRAFVGVSQALGLMDDKTADLIRSTQGWQPGPIQQALDELRETLADPYNIRQQRLALVGRAEEFARAQAERDKRARDEVDAQTQYSQRLAEIESSGRDRRAELIKSRAASEAETEATYYSGRLKRMAQFGLEAERAEQDHQRNIANMRQSLSLTLEDAVANRDAIAARRAIRQFEIQRQQAEASYATQTERRSQDQAAALRDEEEAFTKQRETRLSSYDAQLADLEENERKQTQAAEDARRERLAAIEESYSAETRLREKFEADLRAFIARSDALFSSSSFSKFAKGQNFPIPAGPTPPPMPIGPTMSAPAQMAIPRPEFTSPTLTMGPPAPMAYTPPPLSAANTPPLMIPFQGGQQQVMQYTINYTGNFEGMSASDVDRFRRVSREEAEHTLLQFAREVNR